MLPQRCVRCGQRIVDPRATCIWRFDTVTESLKMQYPTEYAEYTRLMRVTPFDVAPDTAALIRASDGRSDKDVGREFAAMRRGYREWLSVLRRRQELRRQFPALALEPKPHYYSGFHSTTRRGPDLWVLEQSLPSTPEGPVPPTDKGVPYEPPRPGGPPIERNLPREIREHNMLVRAAKSVEDRAYARLIMAVNTYRTRHFGQRPPPDAVARQAGEWQQAVAETARIARLAPRPPRPQGGVMLPYIAETDVDDDVFDTVLEYNQKMFGADVVVGWESGVTMGLWEWRMTRGTFIGSSRIIRGVNQFGSFAESELMALNMILANIRDLYRIPTPEPLPATPSMPPTPPPPPVSLTGSLPPMSPSRTQQLLSSGLRLPAVFMAALIYANAANIRQYGRDAVVQPVVDISVDHQAMWHAFSPANATEMVEIEPVLDEDDERGLLTVVDDFTIGAPELDTSIVPPALVEALQWIGDLGYAITITDEFARYYVANPEYGRDIIADQLEVARASVVHTNAAIARLYYATTESTVVDPRNVIMSDDGAVAVWIAWDSKTREPRNANRSGLFIPDDGDVLEHQVVTDFDVLMRALDVHVIMLPDFAIKKFIDDPDIIFRLYGEERLGRLGAPNGISAARQYLGRFKAGEAPPVEDLVEVVKTIKSDALIPLRPRSILENLSNKMIPLFRSPEVAQRITSTLFEWIADGAIKYIQDTNDRIISSVTRLGRDIQFNYDLVRDIFVPPALDDPRMLVALNNALLAADLRIDWIEREFGIKIEKWTIHPEDDDWFKSGIVQYMAEIATIQDEWVIPTYVEFDFPAIDFSLPDPEEIKRIIPRHRSSAGRSGIPHINRTDPTAFMATLRKFNKAAEFFDALEPSPDGQPFRNVTIPAGDDRAADVLRTTTSTAALVTEKTTPGDALDIIFGWMKPEDARAVLDAVDADDASGSGSRPPPVRTPALEARYTQQSLSFLPTLANSALGPVTF